MPTRIIGYIPSHKKGGFREPPLSFRLALGELEPFAGSGLTVFLALLHAGVPREEAGLLQSGPEFRVELAQGPGDAVLERVSLTGNAAAADVDVEIELAHLVGDSQGLLDDLLEDFPGKVVVEIPVVDREHAGSILHPDPGNRRLSLSRRINTLVGHNHSISRRSYSSSKW